MTERDRNVLLVHVQENRGAQISASASISAPIPRRRAFNLIGNHTRRWLNSYGGEWRNELQIGRTQRLVNRALPAAAGQRDAVC